LLQHLNFLVFLGMWTMHHQNCTKSLCRRQGDISRSTEEELSFHLRARFIIQLQMVSRRSKATRLSLPNVAEETKLRVTLADHSLV
jgi:hypothetical protein